MGVIPIHKTPARFYLKKTWGFCSFEREFFGWKVSQLGESLVYGFVKYKPVVFREKTLVFAQSRNDFCCLNISF